MEEKLHEEQYQLLQQHNILISCFSFQQNEQTHYRFYFTDLKNRHVFNPTKNVNGKISFPSFIQYDEGLKQYIESAKKYLNDNGKSPIYELW